jgi:hypothetical protein
MVSKPCRFPATVPDILQPSLEDATEEEIAIFASHELQPLWRTLIDHKAKMIAEGWHPTDAVAALVGAVLTPLRMGHDAAGSLNHRVRGSVHTKKRKRAAELATELAALLDEIAREPLPPDAAISVGALLPERWQAPTYFRVERPSNLLMRMAEGLDQPPKFTDAPGLASQKRGWRGFLREVSANLKEYGFELREVDAVALVQAICRSAGVPEPGRDAVHDAMRKG